MAQENKPRDEGSCRDTRSATLEAAIELFAHKGLDGASVREIVKKAGANLSAVNYHFGSKVKLYVEAVKHVITSSGALRELVRDLDALSPSDPQAFAAHLWRNIRAAVEAMLDGDAPPWFARLLARSLVELSPELQGVVAEYVDPMRQALIQALERYVPGLSPADAKLWVNSLFAQLHWFSASRSLLCRDFDIEKYTPEFVAQVANHVANGAIRALALCPPEGEESGR